MTSVAFCWGPFCHFWPSSSSLYSSCIISDAVFVQFLLSLYFSVSLLIAGLELFSCLSLCLFWRYSWNYLTLRIFALVLFRTFWFWSSISSACNFVVMHLFPKEVKNWDGISRSCKRFSEHYIPMLSELSIRGVHGAVWHRAWKCQVSSRADGLSHGQDHRARGCGLETGLANVHHFSSIQVGKLRQSTKKCHFSQESSNYDSWYSSTSA